jgi:AbrB family looped-hinge helix DNA binding protein
MPPRDTVKLSSKGQIVIPARIRRRLGLKTGETLHVRAGRGKEIVLTAEAPADDEIDALRDRMRSWVDTSGRDPEAELYERRRVERERSDRRRRAARGA